MLFFCFSRPLHTSILLALLFIFITICTPILAQATPMPNVFINEIHYDNIGGDSNEYVEIVSDTSIDLTDWSLWLYNGNNGERYNSFGFDLWSYTDSRTQFDFFTIETQGIQNGSPDGIVLFNGVDVIQFLSYEGSFIASDGVANGISSTDIGVSESSSTPVGFSLQLTGEGSRYSDFVWSSPQANTFGAMNTGQEFVIKVSEPSSFSLILILLVSVLYYQRVYSFPFALIFSNRESFKWLRALVERVLCIHYTTPL
jgi:hypothetical protein